MSVVIPQGVRHLKGVQYSVFSFFLDSYPFYGYKL